MAKLSNWQASLDRYIAENHQRPFSYDPALGLDCCRFTFGAIRVQIGKPVGEQFADAYKTRREALETMLAYCGRPSLSMAIFKLFKECGFDATHPNFAARGDAVLTPKPGGGEFLGILALNGKDVISVGENGLRRVPISIRCRSWRIK
jgi:hypothetical protein